MDADSTDGTKLNPTTVRFSNWQERQIERLETVTGEGKSEFVRNAVAERIGRILNQLDESQ
jgi:hypothetical protein